MELARAKQHVCAYRLEFGPQYKALATPDVEIIRDKMSLMESLENIITKPLHKFYMAYNPYIAHRSVQYFNGLNGQLNYFSDQVKFS